MVAGLIGKPTGFDTKLPGLTTVTVALPTEAIKLAATVAVNWVLLPKVVGCAAPFQSTMAPDTKPVPFTVSVNPGPPAVADGGDRLVIAGNPTMSMDRA